jgi:UPF0716 protein FxsA
MRSSERQTVRRIRVGPILLVAFVVVPLAEIAVLIRVGSWLGLAPTLALIVLSAVVGTWVLRRQGFGVLARARRQMEQGVMPVAEVFEGLCLLVAGALLLTPGFLTDAAGALLLVPPVRALLYRWLGHYLERHVGQPPGAQPFGAKPGAANDAGPVIDAEFEEITSDEVTSDEVPPPRGGWDRRS